MAVELAELTDSMLKLEHVFPNCTAGPRLNVELDPAGMAAERLLATSDHPFYEA
jgi:hypothetical protein